MLDEKNVRSFSCPSCGGGLDVVNPRSRYVSCPYCGTSTDLTGGNSAGEQQDVSKYPPRSFLKLGMTGKFDGKVFHIIGRTSWRSDYNEYWSDVEGSGYSEEVWNYDDWLLISEEGYYMSIIEDSQGYRVTEQVVPKYPSLPDSTKMQHFFKEGTSKTVQEYGQGTILYYEGESTYLVRPGNRTGFSQYKENHDYIAEWRFDEAGEIKEIEFFEEKFISGSELEDCFRSDEDREARRLELEKKNKVRSNNRKVFRLLALLNLILVIILALTNDSYRDVFRENVIFETIEEGDYTMRTVDLDTLVQLTKVYENKIELTAEDRTIKLNLTPAGLPETGEVNMHVILEDDSTKEVFHVSEFYVTSPDEYIKFEEPLELEFEVNKVGKYTPKVMFEFPYYSGNYAQNVNADVVFMARGRSLNWVGYLFMAIILFIISLFIRKVKKLK